MRVAVCGDNKVVLEFISRNVGESLTSLDVVHEISKFESGMVFISQHEKTPFDVVFLDIKMPDIDGFEVAKSLRILSDSTQIVFVTTEDGLVYDSFDYQPFCFIPKTNPEILKVKLETVIKKLTDKLAQNRKICLKLPHDEERYIYTDSILYVFTTIPHKKANNYKLKNQPVTSLTETEEKAAGMRELSTCKVRGFHFLSNDLIFDHIISIGLRSGL